MGVWEALSLVAVLMLSLYGCAQAVTNLVQLLLRPSKPEVMLWLALREDHGIEQQIRFAKHLSKELRIPLAADVQGLCEDSVRIAELLLSDSQIEKLPHGACEDKEGCV